MKKKTVATAVIITIVLLLAFPLVAHAQTAEPTKPAFTADDAWALWGIALSFAAAYVPGISNWFDGLPSTKKPLVMIAGLFVLCAGKMLIVCWGQWSQILAVWPDYLKVFIEALLVNLTTYTYGVKQQKQAADAKERAILSSRLGLPY